MIPVELELKNFLAYRDPPPLNLEGVHIACLAGPNGAGKSSILDAMTWALWGKARTNTHDDLMHQVHEDGERRKAQEMQVALTFEHDDLRYKVVRQRRATKRGESILDFQIWDPGADAWRPISEATIRDTQAKIDGLLRMDYDTFVNSAFLVQGRADEFTTKTPAQRKQVLASILGLEQWETYERRARDRARQQQDAIQRLDGRIEEIERELAREAQYKAELAAAERAAEDASAKLEAAEKEWADLEAVRSEMIALQRQIDESYRRTTTLEKDLKDGGQELESLRAQADKAALRGALSEVQTRIHELEPLKERLDELEQEASAHKEESAQRRGANEAMVPGTEPIKSRISTLERADEPLCPTCGQPLTESHRAELLASLQEDLDERRERYRLNRERIQELNAALEKIQKEKVELDRQLQERPALEKRAGELEAALAHADEAAERVRLIEKRIRRWGEDLEAEKRGLTLLEQQADRSEKRLRAASLTRADLDRLRGVKRMADEKVGGARQKLAALKALRTQRRKRQEERDQNAADLGLFEELREAFSKRGVPAMIIETVVPELERSANGLLGRLTDNRMHLRIETQREIKTGERREALDIFISDELGTRPYELYSGGEAFRINFAIRIALSRLLARRAGAQLRSLFIDEGFGTQDARGREQLVSAINNIQDDFDRILVITHIEELKEAFPTRIEVLKTPQGSQFQLV
jgi:exonuclease SbcC